jgi:hypothetical protein
MPYNEWESRIDPAGTGSPPQAALWFSFVGAVAATVRYLPGLKP